MKRAPARVVRKVDHVAYSPPAHLTSSVVETSHVVPAPRGRLVRRSLGTMRGCVVARRYRIIDTIGAGGMGSVYEAVDLETGCVVALKALQPGAYDPMRLKRLRREAKAMTAVQSEHVCKVHYLGVERGTPFIVMERLHGETLRTRLTEEGPLTAAEAVGMFCQILDALTATHEAGIIHRDIKPSNVFVLSAPGEAPRVKLIDYGLAKVIRAGTSSAREVALEMELTSSEVVAGTLHFLAPEQLLSVGDLDERVDVYSAAVTLYEMLAGHRAHRGTYSDIIHDIVFKEPPRITDTRPDLPPVFDDVLGMAMAKSRERRFASAAAFKRALVSAWDAWRHNAPFESGICETTGADRAAYLETDDGAEVVEIEAEASPEATMLDEDLPTLRPPPLIPARAPTADADEDVELPTVRPPPFFGE